MSLLRSLIFEYGVGDNSSSAYRIDAHSARCHTARLVFVIEKHSVIVWGSLGTNLTANLPLNYHTKDLVEWEEGEDFAAAKRKPNHSDTTPAKISSSKLSYHPSPQHPPTAPK